MMIHFDCSTTRELILDYILRCSDGQLKGMIPLITKIVAKNWRNGDIGGAFQQSLDSALY